MNLFLFLRYVEFELNCGAFLGDLSVRSTMAPLSLTLFAVGNSVGQVVLSF